MARVKEFKLPRAAKIETHVWADFIELKCLVNMDGIMSKSDVYDLLNEERDFTEVFEPSEDEDPNDAFDEGVDDQDLAENAEIQDQEEVPLLADKENLLIDEWFIHLKYRAEVFKDFYPFEMNPEGDLLFKKAEITKQHKFYIFLLISSNTRILDTGSNQFTDSFEDLSQHALRLYLNIGCEVKIFGRYPGNLWTKINSLAAELDETVICKIEDFSPQDSGDGGLDIVGWKKLGDNNKGFLITFGQCACTLDEWEAKQHSSSPAAWRSYITLKSPPSNLTFVPFFYRSATGEWHAEHKIQESILLDRQRLVYLLNPGFEALDKRLPYAIVDEVIDARESLI